MPANFTDQEWKDYINKVKEIKPLNDKEWEEYDKQLHLGEKNPNYEFYPKPSRGLTPPPTQNPTQKYYFDTPPWSCGDTICCILIVFFIVAITYFFSFCYFK